MNLGLKIRKKRKELGLSQEKLGEMIGVSKMSISKYENNIVDNMAREKVKLLSDTLDIPIKDFIDLENNEIESEEITAEEFKNEVLSLLDKAVMNEMDKGYFIQTLNLICDKDDIK